MPTLHWLGKDKVINHHQDVPFRLLDHQYGARPDGTQTAEPTGSGNQIIHGDNLEALKALLPRYEGRVKCIYIDPPYNTGNEGWVYNDNVNDPKIKKWLSQVVGKEGEDLSRHDKWLCMMYPRLKLLHKLLHEEGIIMISLDENEITNLRFLLDEIFGRHQFVSLLTIVNNPKGRVMDKYFSTSHEYCMVYSKTILPAGAFSIQKTDYQVDREYRLQDGNGVYRLIELRNTHREFNRDTRNNLWYPIYVSEDLSIISLEIASSLIEVYPVWDDSFEGCWTWGLPLAIKDSNLLVAKRVKGRIKVYRKAYAHKNNGERVFKKLSSVWQNPAYYTDKGQQELHSILGIGKKEFPFPKPVKFIEQLVELATGKDSIVLDSFAGSGTTAHAVLNLNKSDNGNRKFILIEMEE